jgi:hypothetical protein
VYGDLDRAIERADRERRGRAALVAGIAAAAVVVVVVAGAIANTGGKDAAPPAGPSPSHAASVRYESPGSRDRPVSLYGANGALVLVTLERTDRIGTATLWRKDSAGWQKLGTLERAVPLHWRADSDGTRLTSGPGVRDIVARLGQEGVGFSSDGGATWTYLAAPPTAGACADCFGNVHGDYLYLSAGEGRALWRAGFGARTWQRVALPPDPGPQTRYRFPLVLDNGLLISGEATDDQCLGGYRISRDHGDTWSERRTLPRSTCLTASDRNTAFACDEGQDCYGGQGVYRSTDLVHWKPARGLSEGWSSMEPVCSGWDASRRPFIEWPVRAGDEFFSLVHLNYRDGREIRPRRGLLQTGRHEVEHLLVVSRDDCHTWQRVRR